MNDFTHMYIYSKFAARNSRLHKSEMTLFECIEKNKDMYDKISEQRDIDSPAIDRAIRIVTEFIKEKQLIVFGGLAIDYALRLVGDLDVLSTDSVNDSYELVMRLAKHGFGLTGSVRGIHVQTMRVRAVFTFVCDIGFVPKTVFDKIKTIDYQGFKIVHPHFQMIDMYLSLSYPLSNPPTENIFNRWKKDIKRLNKLSKAYPFAITNIDSSKLHTVTAVIKQEYIIHGFVAFAMIRTALDEMITTLNDSINCNLPPSNIAKLECKIQKNNDGMNEVTIKQQTEQIIFASYQDVDVYDKKYRPYTDLFPESYEIGNTLVVSTKDKLLSICKIKGYSVVSIYVLLQWLLYCKHRYADEFYDFYYQQTVNIIDEANVIFNKLIKIGYGKQQVIKLYLDSPFAPSITTVGDSNQSDAYLIRVANQLVKMGIATLEDRTMLAGLPMNIYPEKTRNLPTYVYNTELFHKDGSAYDTIS
jgi:Poly(A) polymerase catalytic subunit